MNGSLAWKFRCQAKTSATATALNPSREAIRRSTNPNLSNYFRLAFSRLSCFGQLLLELDVISLRRAELARSLLFRKSEEPDQTDNLSEFLCDLIRRAGARESRRFGDAK